MGRRVQLRINPCSSRNEIHESSSALILHCTFILACSSEERNAAAMCQSQEICPMPQVVMGWEIGGWEMASRQCQAITGAVKLGPAADVGIRWMIFWALSWRVKKSAFPPREKTPGLLLAASSLSSSVSGQWYTQILHQERKDTLASSAGVFAYSGTKCQVQVWVGRDLLKPVKDVCWGSCLALKTKENCYKCIDFCRKLSTGKQWFMTGGDIFTKSMMVHFSATSARPR